MSSIVEGSPFTSKDADLSIASVALVEEWEREMIAMVGKSPLEGDGGSRYLLAGMIKQFCLDRGATCRF